MPSTSPTIPPGHIIRHNIIADTYGCEVSGGVVGRATGKGFPTSGIYLDNYTSNCVVSGNLIVRCGSAGILLQGGRGNLIEGNIIVDCLAAIRIQDVASGMEYWRPMAGFMTGNHLLRNISCQTGEGSRLFSLQAWTDRVLAQSDWNLFWQTGGGEYRLEHWDSGRSVTLSERQREGYDTHSVKADPLFVDPGHDDYRLKPESPAFALGFEPLSFLSGAELARHPPPL